MTEGWRPVRRIPTSKHLKVRLRQWATDLILRRRKRAHRQAHSPTVPARAAFVVGCQRSGTDMVLWRLDRSLDVDRFDESARAAFNDCRIRDVAVRDRLVAASAAKRVIFKPVCDSHNVARLLAEHEGARAVWVYRDFRDVANSAVQRWGNMNLRWVQELARGGGDWGRRQWNRELITPERQQQIEAFCRDDLTPHGAAAVFWYLVNCTFFGQELESDERVILARYEDLVTRPADEFRRLCKFFGVSFQDAIVADVFASSVRHASGQPIAAAVTEACQQVLDRLDQVHAERCGPARCKEAV
jgi:hypothetical protein